MTENTNTRTFNWNFYILISNLSQHYIHKYNHWNVLVLEHIFDKLLKPNLHSSTIIYEFSSKPKLFDNQIDESISSTSIVLCLAINLLKTCVTRRNVQPFLVYSKYKWYWALWSITTCIVCAHWSNIFTNICSRGIFYN